MESVTKIIIQRRKPKRALRLRLRGGLNAPHKPLKDKPKVKKAKKKKANKKLA
jgi:hypothetical protein